jgi:hypothetical protein
MSFSTFVDGESCSLLPPPKVQTNNNLAPHSLTEKRLEELQQNVKYEEKTWQQAKGKLQAAKFFSLLCDFNIVECTKTLSSSVKSLNLPKIL